MRKQPYAISGKDMRHISMLDLKLEYQYMKKDIDDAIARCLEHQRWILGPEVNELEEKVADYFGVKHCIGVSSGTDALVLSLRALAIKYKGTEYFDKTDQIITAPFTFTATGDAILRAGATPVFVDIDPVAYNIDPEEVKEYLESASKVVGIIPVHLYGQSCDMDEIMAIAKEYNLFVLEDVAQAFGGMWKGKKLGSIGNAGIFSFFPSKNLGGFGDGGLIATSDAEIADLVRILLKHGGKDKYNAEHIGYNARLDTLQSAVLIAKLRYVEEFNRKRRDLAEFYNRELASLSGLTIARQFEYAYHVYHQYTIRVANGKRDDLQMFLKGKGISTMIYYPVPLHLMRVFEERCVRSNLLEEAERAAKEVLSLPIEPLMGENETKAVVKAIKCWSEQFKQ